MSGSIAAAGANPAAATANGPRLASDFNTFLTLLTTQLRNQSPTDPLDTNQMTNQLVQFASVEQQITMNRNLNQLISLQQAAQLTAAAPLIGRRIEVDSDRVALQEGRAEIRLPPAGTARFAEVSVLDASGRVLRQEAVTLGAEARGWSWDGRDLAGRSLADGTYRVQVNGRGPNGEAVSIPFAVRGTVTGAERTSGQIALRMGSLSLGFESLRSVLPDG